MTKKKSAQMNPNSIWSTSWLPEWLVSFENLHAEQKHLLMLQSVRCKRRKELEHSSEGMKQRHAPAEPFIERVSG